MPFVGRLADRHGQRTVVLVLSLVHAVSIAALVAGALAGRGASLLAVPAAGRDRAAGRRAGGGARPCHWSARRPAPAH
ncbi:hypothetical protein ABT317_47980, partial [Streptomyces carpinensis]